MKPAGNGQYKKGISYVFICLGIISSILHALFDVHALFVANQPWYYGATTGENIPAIKQMWLSHVLLFSIIIIILLAFVFVWAKKAPKSSMKQNLLCLASVIFSLIVMFLAIASFLE